MSRLEVAAAPVVGPLLRGDKETLTNDEARLAARWLLKTAIAVAASCGQPWRLDPQSAALLRDGHLLESRAAVCVARIAEAGEAFASASLLRDPSGQPRTLFIDAARDHLAMCVAIAAATDPLPGWRVLTPHNFVSLTPPPLSAILVPTSSVADVVGAQIARLKLLQMVGQAQLGPLA